MVRISLVLLLLLMACESPTEQQPSGHTPDAGAVDHPPGYIAAEPQRDGDAERGYDALVNGGYVGCGVPYSAYAQAFGSAPQKERLPGRRGLNEQLPYNYNAFRTVRGVDAVSPNCLQCHGDTINGEIIIGLGNTKGDYTGDIGSQAILAGAFVSDPLEREEWEFWKDRIVAIAPYTMTSTVGVNPADNLAAVLFAHRNQDTLAWSYSPILDLPPEQVVPVDVPPWWNMKKKNAMFYSAAGRGDHARIMMTASTLCVGTREEAELIDSYFPDVRAFILSLEAPAYLFDIDEKKASIGKDLFEETCSICHGTYGEDEEYPNRLIDLDDVGTDTALALGAGQFADRFIDWFNGSFYGEGSRLDPQLGYVAPPLDGIWATAPYLHNGSVPTLELLLDSSKRPVYWTRSFTDDDYNELEVGWNYTALAAGQKDESNATRRVLIYDTTNPGYGNGGHVYGDDFNDDERSAVIEYLKSL